MFCTYCGKEMADGFVICPGCGASTAQNATHQQPDPSQMYAQPVVPPVAAPKDERGGLAIAGFVVSLVSIVCCYFGVVTGIVGLILSILGMKSTTKKGLAIAGVIISAVAIFIWILYIAYIVLLTSSGFWDGFWDEFWAEFGVRWLIG